MIRRGLFVTGTDTGVGKTWVGTQIAALLRREGVPVAPRKPVESGCERRGGELVPADGEAYHRAVNETQPLAQITPYRLHHAISPQRAAQLEQADTTLEHLLAAALAGVGEDAFLLVEGAGGFYSPLALDGSNADLAERLGLPVLLVAPDRLGVINHVHLSLEAIRHRRLPVFAVVLNGLDDGVPPQGMDNLEDLCRLPCPVFQTQCGVALTQGDPLVRALLAANA